MTTKQALVEPPMQVTEGLLPCPFCGSDDLVQCGNGDGNAWVSCNACQAEGPTTQTPFGWNTRQAASPPVESGYASELRVELDRLKAKLRRNLETPPPVTVFKESADEVERVAERLIDQRDEPWPSGTESDRLHYWRDKCLKAAADLRALKEGASREGLSTGGEGE